MAGDNSILPWLRALIGSSAPPPTPGPPSSWPTAGATPPPSEERYAPPEGEGYVPGAEQLPEAWEAVKPYLQASPETRAELARQFDPERHKPPPSATPVMRAATPMERVGDRLQDFYGGAAAHPLGKIADLLGVSDLEGVRRSFEEPPPEVNTAAQLPTGPIKLPRGGGALHRSYRRGSGGGLGANHPLKPANAERVIRLHDMGENLPRQGDWRGLNAPEYVASFGVGRDAENRARQYLRGFAANTPATDVPTSAREMAAAHAWRLNNPGKELVRSPHSPDLLLLPGENITMAGTKVDNINRAWRDEPLSGLKVDAFGNFMLDELGPLGHPMARNRHPGLINWQHETPLIDMPWDRHAGWGVGDVPNDWKLDDEYKHLKKLMSPWEGLIHPGSMPPKPLASNQGGFTNKDLYDRLSWGLGDTLVGHDPSSAMQPLFGRFWSGAQAQKKLMAGKRPVFDGGLLDIHRDVGLLEPGAMMDPDQIYRALEMKKPWGNLGWGPGY